MKLVWYMLRIYIRGWVEERNPTESSKELLYMIEGRVNLTKKQIAEFCIRNHIKKFAFFGSVLRDDFRSDSDVDILIELDKRYRTSLMKMAGMEIELSEMIGRKVDLRTPNELSDYFRDEVLNEAEVQYEG
jgi:predicted nucleotidyltransferase